MKLNNIYLCKYTFVSRYSVKIIRTLNLTKSGQTFYEHPSHVNDLFICTLICFRRILVSIQSLDQFDADQENRNSLFLIYLYNFANVLHAIKHRFPRTSYTFIGRVCLLHIYCSHINKWVLYILHLTVFSCKAIYLLNMYRFLLPFPYMLTLVEDR